MPIDEHNLRSAIFDGFSLELFHAIDINVRALGIGIFDKIGHSLEVPLRRELQLYNGKYPDAED